MATTYLEADSIPRIGGGRDCYHPGGSALGKAWIDKYYDLQDNPEFSAASH